MLSKIRYEKTLRSRPVRRVPALVAGLCLLLGQVSCGSSSDTLEQETLQLNVSKTSLDYTASQQFISVTASTSWTLSWTYSQGDDWLSLDQTAGNGNTSGIVLSVTENTTEESRSCTVVLTGESLTSTVTIIQNYDSSSVDSGQTTDPGGSSGTASTLSPDTPGAWLELPATDDENLYFFTRTMTRGSKTERNYSFYLDPEAKISVWVAYPLNSGLIGGSGTRTDAWGLDPKVPRAYQPVIFSSFTGSYDRGHQLPSADRYGSGINETTFYGTNMTPQLGSLNQNIWATLESNVRDWARSLDTLYVVTGADINGSTQYAYDNDGKAITVPVGYFKALLGYKKGGSIGNATGGYIGIAFYFEHRSYSTSDVMTASMTIDELEAKLGYDFFVNLPAKIGSSYAAIAESTIDSWW